MTHFFDTRKNVNFRFISHAPIVVEYFTLTEQNCENGKEVTFVVDLFDNPQHQITLTYAGGGNTTPTNVFVRFWQAMHQPDWQNRVTFSSAWAEACFNSLRCYSVPIIEFSEDSLDDLKSIFNAMLNANPYWSLRCNGNSTEFEYYKKEKELQITMNWLSYLTKDPILSALYRAAGLPTWTLVFTKSFGDVFEEFETESGEFLKISLMFS